MTVGAVTIRIHPALPQACCPPSTTESDDRWGLGDVNIWKNYKYGNIRRHRLRNSAHHCKAASGNATPTRYQQHLSWIFHTWFVWASTRLLCFKKNFLMIWGVGRSFFCWFNVSLLSYKLLYSNMIWFDFCLQLRFWFLDYFLCATLHSCKNFAWQFIFKHLCLQFS